MKSWIQKDPPDERNMEVNIYKHRMKLWAGEIEFLPYDENMISTLKYDGELNFAFFDNGKVTFANRYNRLREDMPTTSELASILTANGIKSATIAGELYAVGPNESKLKLGPVMHRIKSPDNEEEEQSVRFGAFDIIQLDGKNYQDLPYDNRIELLSQLVHGKTVHTVPYKIGREGALELWDLVTSKGMEGIIIRSEEHGNIKIKQSLEVDLVVIGLKTGGISWDRGEAGSLVVAFMDKEGVFRYAGTVGGGLRPKDIPEFEENPQYFRKWWFDFGEENNMGEQAMSGKWVRTVPPIHIITVKADDWVVADRPAFSFDSKNGYTWIGDRIAAVGQKPRMVNYRKDKQVCNADLRLEQIPELED
jgi:ATP-dependent DNA ligase